MKAKRRGESMAYASVAVRARNSGIVSEIKVRLWQKREARASEAGSFLIELPLSFLYR